MLYVIKCELPMQNHIVQFLSYIFCNEFNQNHTRKLDGFHLIVKSIVWQIHWFWPKVSSFLINARDG